MNILATFSGAKYHATTQRIVEDAPKLGADAVMVYDDRWLRTCRPGFCERLKWFFEQKHGTESAPRGVCWFCWKPLVILDALHRLAPGDVLLYTDADTVPIAPLTPLFDRCRDDGGVMLFRAVGCREGTWTKRDALLLMNADTPANHDGQHAVARFLLFQKGGKFPARQFLFDWLAYVCNPFINTFEPSVLGPDQPELQQHRTEQSVLSLLARRYGVRLYREACQFGGWDGPVQPNEVDIPGPFFFQHGAHSFRPGYAGDEREGSAWRNIQD